MEFFRGCGVWVFHTLQIKIKGQKDSENICNTYVSKTMYLSGKWYTRFCTLGITYYSWQHISLCTWDGWELHVEFFKRYGVWVFHSLQTKIKGKKTLKYFHYVPNTMNLCGRQCKTFWIEGKIKYYSLVIWLCIWDE